MTSTEVSRETLQRQAVAAFDRAFQQLFSVIGEVSASYKQCESVDGGNLDGVSSQLLDEKTKEYKEYFDCSGPALHVDSVLELYAAARNSLHRGYQCDSWLNNPSSVIYSGRSASAPDSKVLRLDAVSKMLQAIKRGDQGMRDKATTLRVSFSHKLYGVFISCLRYANVVEGESNVRLVTPEVSVDSDLETMQSLQTEILSDLPKPSVPSPTVGVGASPLAGIASMMQGGLGDIVNSLLHTLPSITQTVTNAVSRTTGQQITDTDQRMIDSTMSNITSMLGDQEAMKSMLADLGNGPDGISRFVSRILAPGAAPADTAPPQVGSKPPETD